MTISNRYDYAVKEISVGQMLASFRLSKIQGQLSEAKIRYWLSFKSHKNEMESFTV